MLAGLPILEEQMPSSEIWLKRRKDLVSRVLSLACVLCSIVMASNNHYSYDPGCLGYGNNLGYGVQPGDGNPNIDRPNVPRYPQLNSLDNNVYYPPNQGHISSYESPIQNPGAVNGYTHPSMYPPQHLQVNQGEPSAETYISTSRYGFTKQVFVNSRSRLCPGRATWDPEYCWKVELSPPII